MQLPIKPLSQKYILQNQQYVYDSWKEAWNNSGWGDDEFFVFDEEIKYLSSMAKQGFFYVIEDKGRIVAFAIGSKGNFPKPKDKREATIYKTTSDNFSTPGYFHELVINPDYRSQGLGGTLIDWVESKLKKAGCDSIMLWTRQNSPSKNLYLRHNYREIARITVKKKNKVGKEDRVYFVKTL